MLQSIYMQLTSQNWMVIIAAIVLAAILIGVITLTIHEYTRMSDAEKDLHGGWWGTIETPSGASAEIDYVFWSGNTYSIFEVPRHFVVLERGAYSAEYREDGKIDLTLTPEKMAKQWEDYEFSSSERKVVVEIDKEASPDEALMDGVRFVETDISIYTTTGE